MKAARSLIVIGLTSLFWVSGCGTVKKIMKTVAISKQIDETVEKVEKLQKLQERLNDVQE